MRLHARDVIYYPDRLSENSNTANQEGGNFFLQDICSHVIIPKKHSDPNTGKEWFTMGSISLSICNLNASDLARPEEGDPNLDYVGEIDLEARKIGELHRRYRCKFDVPSKFSIYPPPVDFSKLNALDVIGEWGDSVDPVTKETYQRNTFWAVVSLKHQACVGDAMFCDIAQSELKTGYNLDYADPEYLDTLKAKGKLKYFKDFNASACRLEGKFNPVWRVKLTI